MQIVDISYMSSKGHVSELERESVIVKRSAWERSVSQDYQRGSLIRGGRGVAEIIAERDVQIADTWRPVKRGRFPPFWGGWKEEKVGLLFYFIFFLHRCQRWNFVCLPFLFLNSFLLFSRCLIFFGFFHFIILFLALKLLV